MKIVIFGKTGMLGRYVYSYLKSKNCEIVPFERIEISELRQKEIEILLKKMNLSKGDVVVNCAGVIRQRKDVSEKDMIMVNSLFPRLLDDECKKVGITLVHISTDCLFNSNLGNYTEDTTPNPIDIYGITKLLGEPSNACVIRTSIIGEEKGRNVSLLEWVKSKKNQECSGYLNHIWNGVTCLELSKIIYSLIENNELWVGVRHIFSPEKISKYELIQMINEIYNLGIKVIPINEGENNIKTLSSKYKQYVVSSIKDQIREMKDFNLD